MRDYGEPEEMETEQQEENEASAETPEAEEIFAAPTAEDLPKRKRKRSVIAVLAIVLVLALAAVGVAYALVWGQPEWKLKNALENTGEEFAKLFENAGEFNRMAENAKTLSDRREYAIELDMTVRQEDLAFGYEQTINLGLHTDYSLPKKQMSGETEFGLSYGDYTQTYEIAFSADGERLMFALPELLKDTYYVPTENFGEGLLNSPLAGLLGSENVEALRNLSLNLFPEDNDFWDTFREKYGDEVDAFFDGLQIEKVDTDFPNSDGELTVYSIRLDWDAAAELLLRYTEFTYETLYGDAGLFLDNTDFLNTIDRIRESDLEFLAGVNGDNCLSALQIFNGEGSVSLLLEGEENLWENIRIFVNEEAVMTGGFESTQDGCRLVLTGEGETLEIVLDDPDKEITFSLQGEELLTLQYGADADGMRFGTDYGGVALEFRLLPLGEIEMLSDDPVNFFTLEEADFEDMMWELLGNIG